MKFAALLLLLAPSAAAEERVERKRTPGARRTQTDGIATGMSPWNMNPDAEVAGAPHEVHQFNQAKFYDEPLWQCRFDTIADAVGCLACANPRPAGGEALIVDIWAMYKRTNFFGDYNAGGGNDGCDCGAWGSLSMSMSGSLSHSMSAPGGGRRRLDGHSLSHSMSHSMSGSMSMSMGDDGCFCGSLSMSMSVPPPPPPPPHVIPVGNCPFCPDGLPDRDVAIPGGSSTCGSLGTFAMALPADNALCADLILPNAELCCPAGRRGRKLDGHSLSHSMSMSSSMSLSMDYAPYVKAKPRRHCVYPERGEFWTCFNSNLVIEPDTDWLGDLGDKPVYLPDGTKCNQDQIDNDECYCYPGALAAALPR